MVRKRRDEKRMRDKKKEETTATKSYPPTVPVTGARMEGIRYIEIHKKNPASNGPGIDLNNRRKNKHWDINTWKKK